MVDRAGLNDPTVRYDLEAPPHEQLGRLPLEYFRRVIAAHRERAALELLAELLGAQPIDGPEEPPVCPYCHRTHLHPWPAGDTSPQPYAAHCGGGPYTIGTDRRTPA